MLCHTLWGAKDTNPVLQACPEPQMLPDGTTMPKQSQQPVDLEVQLPVALGPPTDQMTHALKSWREPSWPEFQGPLPDSDVKIAVKVEETNSAKL